MAFQWSPESKAIDPHSPDFSKGPELKGIGGWLLIAAIQTGLALVAACMDGWNIVAGFSNYPDLTTMIVVGMFFSGVVIVLNIWTIVCIFRLSSWFRFAFIITNIWRIFKNVAEIGLMQMAAPNQFNNPAPLVASIIWGAIWIGYALKSKRVKNTFFANSAS